MLPEANADNGKKSRRVRKTDRKRRYSLEYKLQVVKETLAPGASVSIVARRHDINANVVFCWRKLFRQGELGSDTAQRALSADDTGFIPIHVMDGDAAMRSLPAPQKPDSENAKAVRTAQPARPRPGEKRRA